MNAAVVTHPAGPTGRLAVPVGRRILLLPVDSIGWIVARNRTCEVHTSDAVLAVSRPLNRLVASLPPDRFVQINRSVVINAARVAELRPKTHGDGIAVLTDGTELVVSRSRRRAVLAALTEATRRR